MDLIALGDKLEPHPPESHPFNAHYPIQADYPKITQKQTDRFDFAGNNSNLAMIAAPIPKA
jgi:hypothetical protein